MLPEMAALVRPVVGGRVQHDDVGCRRVVEDLGQVVVGMGVGVLAPDGMGQRPLGSQTAEVRRILTFDRVTAPERLGFEVPPRRPAARAVGSPEETHVALDRGHVVFAVRRRPGSEVHDRCELSIEQHLEGPLSGGGTGRDEREVGHRPSVGRTAATASSWQWTSGRGVVGVGAPTSSSGRKPRWSRARPAAKVAVSLPSVP